MWSVLQFHTCTSLSTGPAVLVQLGYELTLCYPPGGTSTCILISGILTDSHNANHYQAGLAWLAGFGCLVGWLAGWWRQGLIGGGSPVSWSLARCGVVVTVGRWSAQNRSVTPVTFFLDAKNLTLRTPAKSTLRLLVLSQLCAPTSIPGVYLCTRSAGDAYMYMD
jgi:hypothetical protein